MKSSTAEFCVVSYRPDMQRREMVDVGILLATGPSDAQLTIAPNLGKLLALDPNINLAAVHSAGGKLLELVRYHLSCGVPFAQLHGILGNAPSGLLVGPAGSSAVETQNFDELLTHLMARLVRPPSPLRERPQPTSRLHTELRTVFKQAKLLGTQPGDIAKHLVVPRFPIDADTGLFAEFALRNGRLHVTETVDFRMGSAAEKKREAQAKTLVLLQALQTVGKDDLRRYVVVSGASVDWAGPSLNLLGKYADDLVVRESATDWQRYTDTIMAAARAGTLVPVHAH